MNLLWGRDLVSVVRIRESQYFRGFIWKKMYENFVGTLETVRNREYVRTERIDCIGRWRNSFSSVFYILSQNTPFKPTT